jgi:ParB family chromosome partitioning protein
MLGLLKLPNDVQDMILKNEISMGHARVLSKLENVEDIKELATKVKDDSLSVRELENAVNGTYKRNVEINRRPKEGKQEYKYIEEALEEKLGTKVKVLNGKIQINYSSINDLNRIIEILNINIEE